MINTSPVSQKSGGTLDLVPAHKKSGSSKAGLPVELQAKAGVRYCLVDKQGKPVNTDKAIRIGNDLVITLQDGTEVVLKDFFLAKKPVNGNASEDILATEDAPQWLQFESGQLVAVIDGHTDNALATGTLLSTEDMQAALKKVDLYIWDDSTASLLPIDANSPVQLADASEQAGLQYMNEGRSEQPPTQATTTDPITSDPITSAPKTSESLEWAFPQVISYDALPYVGGVLGVLAIAGAAGGGGGGGGGSSAGGGGDGGGSPVTPMDNILLVSPVLGSILPGNDLVVLVYKVKADGTVEKEPFSNGTVGADGKAYLSVGSYTGLVKVVVRDAGARNDFIDGATGESVDAAKDGIEDGVNLAVGYGEAVAGSSAININHITTLIAANVEAGNTITKLSLDTASMAVARVLHIPSSTKLISDTLIPPTPASTQVDLYGLANAVLYAAEKKSPGFIQSLGNSLNGQKIDQALIDQAFRDFVTTTVGSNKAIQTKVSETVGNALDVSPVLGAILPGNDLVVLVYKVKADGTVETEPFINNGTVGADGKAHLNVGSYTGLVKVVVRDAGAKKDFTDDATGEGVDAVSDYAENAVDLAVSFADVLAGSNSINLNHVTTLIAAKVAAGNSITKTSIVTASQDVATALHFDSPAHVNLFNEQLTPPSPTSSTIDFYGLANAVLYAAEKKSPGFIQSLGGSLDGQKIDQAFRDFVTTTVGSNKAIQTKVTETVGNVLDVSPVLGAILPGNDLVVLVYKFNADGTVENDPFIGNGTVGADGKAHLNMGSYTGLVKVVVRDGGSNPDFVNEVTGLPMDANNDVNLAVSYGEVVTVINSINVNHITSLIAAKVELGNNITRLAMEQTNAAVARAFNIPDSVNLGTTPPVSISSPSNGTFDAYGLANAVLYLAEQNPEGFSKLRDLDSQAIKSAFGDFAQTEVAIARPELTKTISIFAGPVLNIKMGQNSFLGSSKNGVDVVVTWASLMVGDTVQLKLGGVNLGAPHIVTANELGQAAQITLNIPKTDWGANGDKPVTVAITQNNLPVASLATLVLHVNLLAPVFNDVETALTRAENAPANQLVFTAIATDQNSKDTQATKVISYSLKANSDDASAFSINSSTGAVTLLGSPDYETKPSYRFTVVATDPAGNMAEQSVSLSITNVDEVAPTFVMDATTPAIAEHTGVNQIVYIASASDSDFNIPANANSVTYSLKATADSSMFSIDSSTGFVTLKGNPDYQTKSSYGFTVIATDAAGNSSEKALSLNISNVDETPPTFSSGNTASKPENIGAGQVVYTAFGSDTDFNAPATASSITYSLMPDVGDSSAFSIDSNTGAVTVAANPDFESKSSYTFTVVATDAAGNAAERTVTLGITNVNEAPTVKPLAPASATFVQGSASARLQLSDVFTDMDAGDSLTYSSGTLPSGLRIENGVVRGTPAAGATGGSVTFTATDQDGLSVTKDILLNLVNKPVVASIAVFDADSDNMAKEFGMSGSNVTLEVRLSEAVTSVVTLTAAHFTATFTAGGAALSSVSYQSQRTDAGQTVLIFHGTLPAGNASSVVLDSLTLNNNLVLTGVTSGNVMDASQSGLSISDRYTLDNTAPDITSTLPTLTLTNSSGNPLTGDLGIGSKAVLTIPLGEAATGLQGLPTGSTSTVFSIGGTAKSASWSQSGDKLLLTYTVAAGDSGAIVINGAALKTALAGSTDLAGNAATLGGGTWASGTFISPSTTRVVDTTAPSVTTSTFSLAENTSAVGTLTATDDQSASAALVWAKESGGTDNNLFNLSPQGVLGFITPPNYEGVAPSYSVKVSVTDAVGNKRVQDVTVHVRNVDEVAPTFSSGNTAVSMAENTLRTGQTVYTAVAADTEFNSPASANSVTYSLKPGAGDAAAFSINSGTGVVTLNPSNGVVTPGDVLDFETKSSYSFTVIAADAVGNLREQVVTLAISNVDEVAPTFTSAATASKLENSGANQVVYTATAFDTDFNAPATPSSIRYSLNPGVGDGSLFTINSSTGAVTLTANPDFETKPDYRFTVLATDAAGNSREQPVTLTITDVNEAPGIKANAPGSATFVTGQSTILFNLADVFTDGDAGDTLTYSSGTLPTGLSLSNGIVSGTPAAAATGSSVTFTATDRAGLQVDKVISLNVVNKPVVAGLSVLDADSDSVAQEIGKGGGSVTLEVKLSEIVTASVATWMAADFTATFTAGGMPLTGVSFQSERTVGSQTVLTFTGTLPSANASSVVLTSLTLNNGLVLTGSSSLAAMDSSQTGLTISDGYTLDSVAPDIPSNLPILSLTNTSNAALSGDVGGGGHILLSVGFGEAVSGLLGLPSTSNTIFTVGGTAKSANWRQSGTNLVLDYTVEAGDNGAITVDSAALKTALASITDRAGNAITLAGGNWASRNFSALISTRKVDTTAPAISSTPLSLAENTTAAGTLMATDNVSASHALVWTLESGGTDNSLFNLSSQGVLSFKAAPDYEGVHGNAYTVKVGVSDAVGNKLVRDITVNVSNVDELAPTINSGSTATAITENAGAGQLVYTVIATDTDFAPALAGSITYSLKANAGDDSAFSISSSTGAVTLTANPDFESKASYSFTVIATDAAGRSTEKPVTLAISNVDEQAPTITSSSAATAIAENSGAGQVVYTATVTDTDFAPALTSSITYSLKAHAGDASAFSINSSTGAVSLNANPDFETKSSYSFTVVATDAGRNFSEKTVSLAITNANEAPSIKASAPGDTIFVPGQTATVLNLSDVFTDVDAGETLTYTLASGSLPSGLSLSNGAVSGTVEASATGGSVTFTARDAGGLSVNKTIQFNLFRKPTISSISVLDASVGSTSPEHGKPGELVTLNVTLSETVTASVAALVAANITATFTAGGNALTGVNFQEQSTDNNKTVLRFTGTLPVGNASSVVLTSLTLGNGLVLTGSSSNEAMDTSQTGLTIGDSYTLDNTAPNVSLANLIAKDANGSQKAAGTPVKTGDVVILTMNLGESLSGLTGLPAENTTNNTILILGGSTAQTATWGRDIPSNTLTLTWTVGASAGVLSVDTNQMRIALTGVSDMAGNVFNQANTLLLPIKNLTVDNTAPALTATALSLSVLNSSDTAIPTGYLNAGDKIKIDINMGEPVSGLRNLPSISPSNIFKVGGLPVAAVWSSTASTLLLTYTVAASDNGNVELDTSALRTLLLGRAITDLAGNALTIPASLTTSNATFNTRLDSLKLNQPVDNLAPLAPGVSFHADLPATAYNPSTHVLTSSAFTGPPKTVFSVITELGSTVIATFTDSAGAPLVKTISGSTSSTVAVDLVSTDFGNADRMIGEGLVQVSIVTTDPAGNVGPATQLSFYRDSISAPQAVQVGGTALSWPIGANKGAIAPTLQAPVDTNIKTLSIQVAPSSGAAPLGSSDQLFLENASGHSLDSNFSGSNVSIGGVAQLYYSYDASNFTLRIWPNASADASTFSNPGDLAAILAAIQFGRDSTPAAGTLGRSFTIDYLTATSTHAVHPATTTGTWVASHAGLTLSTVLGVDVNKALDVTSNLVLTTSFAVSPVPGGILTLTDNGPAAAGDSSGYGGENTTNTYRITLGSTLAQSTWSRYDGSHWTAPVVDAQLLTLNVGGTRVSLNLPEDLDFSSSYTLNVAPGAFAAQSGGGLNGSALSASFNTVTPSADRDISTALGQSWALDGAGQWASSYIWKDMTGWGDPDTPSPTLLDLSSQASTKLAFVGSDKVTHQALNNDAENGTAGVGLESMHLALYGLNQNKLIYIDDQGRNEVHGPTALSNLYKASDPAFKKGGGDPNGFDLNFASPAAPAAAVSANYMAFNFGGLDADTEHSLFYVAVGTANPFDINAHYPDFTTWSRSVGAPEHTSLWILG
ncbi:MAG: cadherin domain-containing protein [Rhodoferax sp.]|nr:cadherin domain-containing protein [Rhodoferax sp.]